MARLSTRQLKDLNPDEIRRCRPTGEAGVAKLPRGRWHWDEIQLPPLVATALPPTVKPQADFLAKAWKAESERERLSLTVASFAVAVFALIGTLLGVNGDGQLPIWALAVAGCLLGAVAVIAVVLLFSVRKVRALSEAAAYLEAVIK
ncbi:hypothetical protein [Geodermatophilus siccatus]|uniref:hypothetical protein n=1 Tax=Geodermatophilus siccatus TaxID=1137991 RepID=UPI00111448E8|nr:hypothetical protein [Geodermatophilus siccatus]